MAYLFTAHIYSTRGIWRTEGGVVTQSSTLLASSVFSVLPCLLSPEYSKLTKQVHNFRPVIDLLVNSFDMPHVSHPTVAFP